MDTWVLFTHSKTCNGWEYSPKNISKYSCDHSFQKFPHFSVNKGILQSNGHWASYLLWLFTIHNLKSTGKVLKSVLYKQISVTQVNLLGIYLPLFKVLVGNRENCKFERCFDKQISFQPHLSRVLDWMQKNSNLPQRQIMDFLDEKPVSKAVGR